MSAVDPSLPTRSQHALCALSVVLHCDSPLDLLMTDTSAVVGCRQPSHHRTSEVATSAAADVHLQATPAAPAFSPSIPGLLVTLPYRPLHYGETIKVSLEAVNPLVLGLTGFVVPLRFDSQRLQLTRAVASNLWLPVAVNLRGVQGSFDVVELSVAGRAGNNPDTA